MYKITKEKCIEKSVRLLEEAEAYANSCKFGRSPEINKFEMEKSRALSKIAEVYAVISQSFNTQGNKNDYN